MTLSSWWTSRHSAQFYQKPPTHFINNNIYTATHTELLGIYTATHTELLGIYCFERELFLCSIEYLKPYQWHNIISLHTQNVRGLHFGGHLHTSSLPAGCSHSTHRPGCFTVSSSPEGSRDFWALHTAVSNAHWVSVNRIRITKSPSNYHISVPACIIQMVFLQMFP